MLKEISYYTTPQIPNPSQEDFKRVYVYKAGQVLVDGAPYNEVSSQIAGFRSKDYTVEIVTATEDYKAARTERIKEKNKLLAEFKADLFAMHGFDLDHKKANLALRIAEEERNHNLSEVADLFDTLVDLIKD